MDDLIKRMIIDVELISLKARLRAASQYVLNHDMRLEVELLAKQILALEAELEGDLTTKMTAGL